MDDFKWENWRPFDEYGYFIAIYFEVFWSVTYQLDDFRFFPFSMPLLCLYNGSIFWNGMMKLDPHEKKPDLNSGKFDKFDKQNKVQLLMHMLAIC